MKEPMRSATQAVIDAVRQHPHAQYVEKFIISSQAVEWRCTVCGERVASATIAKDGDDRS